jgi:hypothetical protein
MPAGMYAVPVEETRAVLVGVRAGDQAARDTASRWNDESKAMISEGFCPQCDGPLTPGLTCRAASHGGVMWSAATGGAMILPPLMREGTIPWPSNPTG